jgi:hypothetical protein
MERRRAPRSNLFELFTQRENEVLRVLGSNVLFEPREKSISIFGTV